MTDNDKLRRLRDWIFYEADVEPNPGGGYSFTEGRANPAHVLIEIDRLLSEPTSPAPAAAPSEAEDYRDQDGNKVSLLQLVRKEPEWAANRIRHMRAQLAAATAPAASPPVTSEAIEQALSDFADDWHHAGIMLCGNTTDEIKRAQEVAKATGDTLRALIAAAIAEAKEQTK